jgi:hypothetical protein
VCVESVPAFGFSVLEVKTMARYNIAVLISSLTMERFIMVIAMMLMSG